MDTGRLTILPPREPRPFWAFGEIVYDRGPIAGVLFYDEYPVEPAEDGAAESAASIAAAGQHRGWLFWAVGEEVGTTPADPWRPRLFLYGPQMTATGVLRQAIATLEERDPPSGTYAETAELVTAMLEVDDPEYLLVPESWAVPAASWRS